MLKWLGDSEDGYITDFDFQQVQIGVNVSYHPIEHEASLNHGVCAPPKLQ